jgi:hypothetical protein
MTITTSTGLTIKFPSMAQHTTGQLLDNYQFTIVKPILGQKSLPLPNPTAASATSEAPLSRL